MSISLIAIASLHWDRICTLRLAPSFAEWPRHTLDVREGTLVAPK